MTEMCWATGAHGDAGVTEMGFATGSIYSRNPGVDRYHLVRSHLISHLIIIYEIHNLSFPLLNSLVLSEIWCGST